MSPVQEPAPALTALAKDGRGPGPALAGLIAALLVGLALGLAGNGYALIYDEIASIKFAQMPLRLLWSTWMVHETNPPLYYSLLRLWLGLVGDSDVRVRALSALIGLVGVACAWRLGRDLAGRTGGAMAALLVAVSQQHVYYSQLARGYILGHSATLIALVGLAGLARAWNAADARPPARALGLYFAGALVAVYSHTTLVILPVVANLWAAASYARHGWRPRDWPPHWKGWLAANLALAIAWGWWGYITWLQMGSSERNVGWIQRPSLPYAVRMTFETYLPWDLGYFDVLSVAAYGALFGWSVARVRSRATAVLGLLALGAPCLLYVISLARPVFLPRTVYFGAGPFLVLVAVGLARLPGRWRCWAIAIVMALQVTALARWYPVREVEPWRGLAAALPGRDAPGTVVVKGVGPAFALQRYCADKGCAAHLVVVPSPLVDHWAGGIPRPRAVDAGTLASLVASHGPVYTVRWVNEDPAPLLGSASVRWDRPKEWGPVGSLGLRRASAVGP